MHTKSAINHIHVFTLNYLFALPVCRHPALVIGASWDMQQIACHVFLPPCMTLAPLVKRINDRAGRQFFAALHGR
jgi:hypothetical protein